MKLDHDWPAGTFIFEANTGEWAVVATPDPATDTYAVLLYAGTDAGPELVATTQAANSTSAQRLARLTLTELASTQLLLAATRPPWS